MRGERGPHGDLDQTGLTGPRGAQGASAVGEWVRWGLTMLAIVITLASTAAWRHEASVRDKADQASLAQRDATDARLGRAIKGNCVVLSVLLENRSDRDATAKLFGSIRAHDPVLFDKLVARARRGDRKLVRAVPLLSCNISDRVIRNLKE